MTEAAAPLLSVVIPVFNESGTIAEILRRVAATPHDKEIVVIDDASQDGSREYLEAVARGEARIQDGAGAPARIRILFQPENRGKGAALRRGFAEARGEILLVQDADLEYDPRDYDALLRPIFDGVADVVYGSRFLGGPQRVEHEDHARHSGRVAGRNLAGAGEPYLHRPMFYGDLFDAGYEAVGQADARLETVGDWAEPFRRGVVYYLSGGTIRGVLLWNVWNRVDAARALLGSAVPAAGVRGLIRPEE